MIEPLSYRKPKSEASSWCMANITPDGWKNAKTSGIIKQRLTSEEIAEFTSVVKSFVKLCPDNQTFMKYCRKYGKKLRQEGMDPTLAFVIEGKLMTYIVEGTGPNFWIEAHRKDEE